MQVLCMIDTNAKAVSGFLVSLHREHIIILISSSSSSPTQVYLFKGYYMRYVQIKGGLFSLDTHETAIAIIGKYLLEAVVTALPSRAASTMGKQSALKKSRVVRHARVHPSSFLSSHAPFLTGGHLLLRRGRASCGRRQAD